MADNAHAWVIGEHRTQLGRGELGAVCNSDLACVDGATHAHATAVVQGDPGR